MLMAARVSNCHSSLRFVVGRTGSPLLAAGVCFTGLRALLDRAARGGQLRLFRRRIKQLTFVHCVKSSHVVCCVINCRSRSSCAGCSFSGHFRSRILCCDAGHFASRNAQL